MPFIEEILNTIQIIICDLQPQQVNLKSIFKLVIQLRGDFHMQFLCGNVLVLLRERSSNFWMYLIILATLHEQPCFFVVECTQSHRACRITKKGISCNFFCCCIPFRFTLFTRQSDT